MATAQKTAQRIYFVRPRTADGQPPAKGRLVWAPNPAQALRHVAADSFDTHVATHADLARLMAEGVKPEQSGNAALTEAAQRDQQQLPA